MHPQVYVYTDVLSKWIQSDGREPCELPRPVTAVLCMSSISSLLVFLCLS